MEGGFGFQPQGMTRDEEQDWKSTEYSRGPTVLIMGLNSLGFRMQKLIVGTRSA